MLLNPERRFVSAPGRTARKLDGVLRFRYLAQLVNITLTGASGSGYVTAESCDGNVTGERSWSNGNVAVGATVANLAVVPLDALGRFCLYNSTAMHMIVDAQGFFMPSHLAGSDEQVAMVLPDQVLH